MELNIKVNEPFKVLYLKEHFNKYREFIFYGGRGGGKTYEIAQFLTFKALQENNIKILCLREYGSSNRNSLLAEFKNVIDTLNLEYQLHEVTLKNENIKINTTSIVFNYNNSKIIFSGINDNTAKTIKSISNIKYCWIDEADFLTQNTYNILKPTIRAENSKLIFSFNPRKRQDFIYQKLLSIDALCYTRKINITENIFASETILNDFENDKKTMSAEMFNHIWLGECLDFNEAQIIDITKIGYFDDTKKTIYDELFICADTAYSKKESADFSVIGIFGKFENEIHLLRLIRGKYEFNELIQTLKYAFNYTQETYKQSVSNIIIEKKASGISLLQELQRTTNLPLREIMPKTDKYSRVSSVLNDLPRLRLPLDKTNPLNSWLDDFLYELKMFRADLKHEHDDQVDVLVYALQFCKNNIIEWDKL